MRVRTMALLACALGAAARPLPAQTAAPRPAAAPYASVDSAHTVTLPADFGSHPEFRTEWWYVTGWLTSQSGEELGFQVTFFRTKPDVDTTNPSAFTPHQLLIAHCALSDPKHGRLWQDQKIRRAGQSLAEAQTGDTRVWIGRWSLARDPATDRYAAAIDAEDFALALTLSNTQAPLLHGAAGVSRKGPGIAAASYYYSLPHMKVSGSVVRAGNTSTVTGEAWFDHEWSSEYLDADSRGWDWIGINLNDGSALMAFRIRGPHGDARWAGGTLRAADGTVQILRRDEVSFEPLRQWTSPRTGIRYPVQWRVHAGVRDFDLEPLMLDQEDDTRVSTGAIYWEGAVRTREGGRIVGRGYLELTGYGEPLKLR